MKRRAEIQATLTKAFGKDLIKTLTRKTTARITGIDWGIPRLNMVCTGDPFVGIPPGRIYEIFGKESSGKTTLCLHAVARAQKEGKIVAYVDSEHALDPRYAKALGVDLDELLFSQPDYGEQAGDIIRDFVKAGVDLVVVDSVAALTPKAEIEGDMDKNQPGTHARLMSSLLRRLTPEVGRHGSTVIFINQMRYKIGVMFGDPTTTTGGEALKFYATIRLRVTKSEAKAKMSKGNMSLVTPGEASAKSTIMTIKAVKNKIGPPFESGEFVINFGQGVDAVLDHFECAANLGIVERDKRGYTVIATGEYIALDELERGLGSVRDAIEAWNQARLHDEFVLVAAGEGQAEGRTSRPRKGGEVPMPRKRGRPKKLETVEKRAVLPKKKRGDKK